MHNPRAHHPSPPVPGEPVPSEPVPSNAVPVDDTASMLAVTSVLCGVAAMMMLPVACGCPYVGVFPLAGAVVSLVAGYRALSKAPYASDAARATTLGKLGMALGAATLVVIVLVATALTAVLLLAER